MRTYGLALLTSLATACGGEKDVAAPPPPPDPLTVKVASVRTAGGHPYLYNGATTYACDFTIHVITLGGRPSDVVSLGTAQLDYRLASNGATSSSFISSLEIRDWFGLQDIPAGKTVNSARILFWAGPFTASFVLRYTVYSADNPFGDPRSSTIFLDCQS